MTLILALTDGERTLLAGDSSASNGHTYHRTVQPKVFAKGGLLLGYTTSFRFGQLLEHDLSVPDRRVDQALMPYLISHLVPAVRTCLQTGGFLETTSGREEGGIALLVAERRLFVVQSDFSVLERQGGYEAVGSGQEHALAVLHATRGLGLPPEQRLRLALETAADFVTTVCGPYWVIEPGQTIPRLLDMEA